MVESCKQLKPWRLMVTAAAIATGAPLIRGPVSLSVVFLFHRPKGHYGARGLKPSAPQWHSVKPDGSKLLRALEDSLSGVLIEDDARIVSSTVQKRYTVGFEREGAIVTVIPLA